MTATKPPAQPAGAKPAPPGAKKKKDADRNRKEGEPGHKKIKHKREKTPAGLWTTVSVHPSMFSLLRFDLALVEGNTRSNDAVKDVLGEDEIQPVDIDLFDLFDSAKVKKGGKYSLYGVPNGAGGKGEPPRYTDEQWQRAVVLFENQTLSPDASKIDSKELAPAPMLGADEAPDATERLAKIQELGEIQLAKYLKLQIEGRPARGIAERGRAAKAEAGVHLERLKALGFDKTKELQEKVTKVFEICQIGAGFDVHQARFSFGDVSVTEKGTFNCTASLIANETAVFLRGVLDLKAFIEDDAFGVKKWIQQKTGGAVTIDAKFGPGQTTLVAKLKRRRRARSRSSGSASSSTKTTRGTRWPTIPTWSSSRTARSARAAPTMKATSASRTSPPAG